MTLLAAALLLALPAAAQPERASYDADPGTMRASGFSIFFGVQGPLSYASITPTGLPKDVADAGEVGAKACQHGLQVPLGLRGPRLSGARGKGGYDRAVEAIRRGRPDLKGIYDVKVDDHIISVLGLYRRQCTEVTARGFK